MGIVTDHLKNLIAKQVDEYGIVIWFDPDKHYLEFAKSFSNPDTNIFLYKNSFFELRYQIKDLITGFEPPRLLVYVPLDETESEDALIELQIAGVTLKPGQQPPSRNTRLSILGRNALKNILGEESATTIATQVDAGKLTLTELDHLGEKGESITSGVVAVIYKTDNVQQIALEFLCNENNDSRLIEKSAIPELALLLQSAFGVELSANDSPASLRKHFARYVLSTEFVSSIRNTLPSALQTIKIATNLAAKEATVSLAQILRRRSDLQKKYAALCEKAETELNLSALSFDLSQLTATETFLTSEKALLKLVESELLAKPTEELVQFAKNRQSGFWATQIADIQAHWALISTTGQLLLKADRSAAELKKITSTNAESIFAAYVGGEKPLCTIDTLHRQMERLYHNFDFELGSEHEMLKQLITKARQRYMEIGDQLSEAFLRQFQAQKYSLPGVLRQTEIFRSRVQEFVGKKKIAYIWVDALRFEMARDLMQALTDEFEVNLEAALAAVPTITEIGMAALLPEADKNAVIVASGDSKLALKIGDKIIKDRKDRVNFLKANLPVNFFETKLEDIVPLKPKVETGIRKADFILLTSQEIDELSEADNVSQARRLMDSTLTELRRAFRILSQLGVEIIILAADHGYLFGDELDEAMKIDSPGGQQVDLHRRVWVGKGGNADSAYVRARISDFGLGSDLELAAPWNFSCFKVKGGAKAYFHGGLSLQELAVPVATIRSFRKPDTTVDKNFTWQLILGSQKISTRFCSVQVKGFAENLFSTVPPKIRVEIRDKGETISTPVSAAYGFDESTGDILMRIDETSGNLLELNTVTLAITKESSQKTVSLHLLDANTGYELSRLDSIEFAISI